MLVTIKFFNSLGCLLDTKRLTVRDDPDGETITLGKIADAIGDIPLSDGDTFSIETAEGA